MKQFAIIIFSLAFINCYGQEYSKSWKEVNYANDSMKYHNLDIYLPQQQKANYPVVISIYGSAWMANNIKGVDLKTLGKPLLTAGFAIVTPNHRSSMDAKFPAQINDIKAVIRFVRANASKYKFDTTFIGITGSSSGGNMAAMAGVSRHVKTYTLGNTTVDLEGNLGSYTSYSSSVDAVVDWFGPTNMLVMDSCGGTNFIHNAATSPASLYIGGAIQENKEKSLLASPITYVDATTPPFLIFHGDKDPVVPHCQSELLFQALQKARVRSQFYLVLGGQHGPGVQKEQYLKMMVDFFVAELNKSKDKIK